MFTGAVTKTLFLKTSDKIQCSESESDEMARTVKEIQTDQLY